MYIYLNGRMTPAEQAKVSLLDHGYLYGVGLFETFRTYAGHPFLLDKHLYRLQRGCRELGMEWERDDERIRTQITALLEANHVQDGYFRLNVSAGEEPLGLPRKPYTQVTEALLMKELPPPVPCKPLWTVHMKRNTPEGNVRWKSHHYLNNILAQQEVPAGYEGVFETEQGYIAEGIVSNLFFVRDRRLYTPSMQTGILNGITRQWVIHAARDLQIDVQEGLYERSFAQEAAEVFITNSIQEIVPVSRWDEVTYPQISLDSITAKLMNRYREQTRENHRFYSQ